MCGPTSRSACPGCEPPAAWLPRRRRQCSLRQRPTGSRTACAKSPPLAATVVFHSIVLQYLSGTERKRFETALAEAGGRAGPEAPLAWLQMEAAGELTDVHLTLWPGGKRCLIARAGYHGDPVEWAEASTRATKADLPAE